MAEGKLQRTVGLNLAAYRDALGQARTVDVSVRHRPVWRLIFPPSETVANRIHLCHGRLVALPDG